MDSTRYVQIICRACGGKIVVIFGQARPATCALCKEPLEPVASPSRSQAPGNPRQTPAGTRVPAAFPRGTFTNTAPKIPRPASTTESGKIRKAPDSPIADLKRTLLGLFTPRS
jgi:hypothetical protein